MSTNFHTAILTGQAGNVANVNAPLASLDAAITAIDTRVDDLEAGGFSVITGNVATLIDDADGVAAGQKTITVDSTTGFIVGGRLSYILADGANTVEYNVIDAIPGGTTLTATTNVGTGGIANNSLITMISESEYQSAQAVSHGNGYEPTLQRAIKAVARGNYYVNAYGADRTGSAESATSFQAALDDAGNGTVILDGVYKISTSLDATGRRSGVTIRADHQNAAVIDWNGAGGNIFDLTHSAYCHFKDLLITVHSGASAAVGILMGRNASGNSAGNHELRDVTVQGNFTKAAILNCSSEVNTLDNVHVYSTGGASAYAYYHDDENGLSAASAYDTLTALANNATVVRFIGGSYHNWGVSGGPVFYFKDITNLSMLGTSMQADGTPTALITLAGTIQAMSLIGIRQEGTPSYGIHVTGTLTQGSVLSSFLAATAAGIYGADGSTIQFSQILGAVPSGTTMVLNAATLAGCQVDAMTLEVTARTAATNNVWYNVQSHSGEPSLTGGIGNIQFGTWSAGNPRIVLNSGGLWYSDLGWGAVSPPAATTPGTCVKKVAVWDETGNVLGYVAIYDGIS